MQIGLLLVQPSLLPSKTQKASWQKIPQPFSWGAGAQLTEKGILTGPIRGQRILSEVHLEVAATPKKQ